MYNLVLLQLSVCSIQDPSAYLEVDHYYLILVRVFNSL